jgi:hypothetical protein
VVGIKLLFIAAIGISLATIEAQAIEPSSSSMEEVPDTGYGKRESPDPTPVEMILSNDAPDILQKKPRRKIGPNEVAGGVYEDPLIDPPALGDPPGNTGNPDPPDKGNADPGIIPPDVLKDLEEASPKPPEPPSYTPDYLLRKPRPGFPPTDDPDKLYPEL